MAEYHAGTHHGVTIVREGDGYRCDRDDHDCARGHMVAVVTNGDVELAERICALLNAYDASRCTSDRTTTGNPGCGWCIAEGHPCPIHVTLPADSCTCSPLYGKSGGADPACPVHQGRKARAPRPPYLGPGCICDGSGRTCPRHGVVL